MRTGSRSGSATKWPCCCGTTPRPDEAKLTGPARPMRDTIVEKLRPILKGPPHAERDVLYVFVEIRKLLDLLLEGADEVKRAEFATLKFFCDWVVHVKLDRS